MLFIILGVVCLIIAAVVGLDMLRFHVAQKRAADPKALGTAAGGTLFIQGGKTYYQMPRGARRLIAEYAMDLRPGSPDMVRFKSIMQKAADEHAREVAETKAKADAAMRKVAEESAQYIQTDADKTKMAKAQTNARDAVNIWHDTKKECPEEMATCDLIVGGGPCQGEICSRVEYWNGKFHDSALMAVLDPADYPKWRYHLATDEAAK